MKVYDSLSETTKKLEKIEILSEFLKKLHKGGKSEWIYLLRGSVLPDYDSRVFGISNQLVIKALGKSFGESSDKVLERFRKIGDLGKVAEDLAEKKKQGSLFSKSLDAGDVFGDLRKLFEVDGKGSVSRKMDIVAGLLSNASGREARYITRTLLNDLKVGVADALLRDAIAEAFLANLKKGALVKGDVRESVEDERVIESAYDLANDFAVVFEAAVKGEKALKKIGITPGVPLKVMLPVKVTEIAEAFRICAEGDGRVAVEHKYDGFRMLIHKKGKKVWLFTRRLDDVTNQFPDVVEAVRKNITGNDFVLDSEVVGYDPKTKAYQPFEAISQRIKRKYEIEKLIKKLPVEINVFDILYHNGKEYLSHSFENRRKKLESVVKTKKLVIRPSFQIITDDIKKAEEFYKKALDIGEEGAMFKRLDVEYRQGRRVGYMVKLKPDTNELDLVIVGAEYGTGKRGGWLTSYYVACQNDKGEFVELGKVSSGLKEISQEGETTYAEMTKLLEPLINEKKGRYVKVKPKLVVNVVYQNIQKSPSYSSGFAMRFPRIISYRPEKPVSEVATLGEVKKEAFGEFKELR